MLLHLDSFDFYATADLQDLYSSVTGSPAIGAYGRRASNGMRQGYGDAIYIVPTLPSPADARVVMGFAMLVSGDFSTASNSFHLVTAWQAGTRHWSLQLTAAGLLQFVERQGDTVLGTTASGLTQNVWHYIELDVLIHSSTGTIDVSIDGINRLSLTGQDTRNAAAAASWDQIQLTAQVTADYTYFDDLYLADGTGGTNALKAMAGDVQVDAVFPDGNGATRNFTPSTGTDDFGVVDEVVPNTSDYLTSTALNDIVTMAFPTAPVSGAAIRGVQINAYAERTDAAAVGHTAVVRQSGTNYLAGYEHGLTIGYTYHRDPMDVQPIDGTSAWTEAAFNAAEFGAKKTT